MKKPFRIALFVVVALLVVAAVLAHRFMDANTFRPEIESRLSAALARKVTLGDLSFSFMTGHLVAKDLAIAEDPKFGDAPFFTAKRLRIGVEVDPLIFHKQLIVRSFEVDSPQIHLLRGEDNTWNYSTLGHVAGSENSQAATATRPATVPDLAVDDIRIRDGSVRMESLPARGNPQVYDHLDVKLEHFSLAKGFPFTMSASLPGDGKVDLSGKLGAVDPQDAASTIFDANLSIKHLDPVTAGYVDPAAGISGIAGLDAHIVSDGREITSDGKVHAEHLILLKGGRAAPNPVDVHYQAVHSLKDNSGQISDLALQTGAVAVHTNGTYKLAQNVPVFDMKLSAPNIPIDSLQALLPAVGAKLPNGAHLRGGTLSARFDIKGTEKDNVITGSYQIKNTELVGYDLGSKISGIAALGGIKTGDHVQIEESRADLRITKAGSRSTNIYSKLPALGESTGSGTVSATGQLDFHLISNVTSAKGLNKIGVDLLTKLNSSSAAAKPSKAIGIPINITGTAENPVITADVSGLFKGNMASLKSKSDDFFKKTGNSISNIFHKKKPDQK